MSEQDSYRRWNFEADDKGIMACKGEHEKSDHCEEHMERLSPHEVLEIINNLRSQCLKTQSHVTALRDLTEAVSMYNPEEILTYRLTISQKDEHLLRRYQDACAVLRRHSTTKM